MDTTLTIKTKKQLRNEVKKTAAEIGVPVTIVVNALLRQFVRDKELVLSAKVPNAETRRALDEHLSGSKKGVKTFKSFDEFKTYMRKL